MWKKMVGPGVVLMLVMAGMSTGLARADDLPGQPIYILNNCNRPIWVAAHYIPPGGSSHVSDGFWKVMPGQRTLILYNNGVWLYVYARDDQGRVFRGTGTPIGATVRGETLDMFPHNTGTGYEPYLITFFNQ